MRLYEMMVIFHPGLEPEAVRASLDRHGAFITERGGSVARVDHWGRRRFAYEVKHLKDGFYSVIEFTADIDTINELDRVLSISDQVVRHKFVRLPETGIPAVVPGGGDDVHAERAEVMRERRPE